MKSNMLDFHVSSSVLPCDDKHGDLLKHVMLACEVFATVPIIEC